MMMMIKNYRLLVFVGLVFSASVSFCAETDLWVMSQCPYGVQAENVVYQVLNQMEDHGGINIRIRYVLNHNQATGELVSLHGEKEVQEDMRQLVIQEFFPDKFWCYLHSRGTHYYDSLWVKDALVCGLDTLNINNLVKKHGFKMAAQEARLCDSLNISGSPTMIINGKTTRNWDGGFSSLYLMLINELRAEGISTNLPESPTPDCFDDVDCLPKSPKHYVHCIDHRCVSELAPKIQLTVVLPDTSYGDISDNMVNIFKTLYLNLTVDHVFFDSPRGAEVTEGVGLEKLPAYIFDSNIQNSEKYDDTRDKLLPVRSKGTLRFLVKPFTVDGSYYPKRQKHEGELGIFVMSDCPFSIAAEESIYAKNKMENVVLHFIAHYDTIKEEFRSLHGPEEVEEAKRQLIIQRYFLGFLWDYLHCRNQSGEVDNCLEEVGINAGKLNQLIEEHGDSLLMEEVRLSKKLSIAGSPTFLWENQYILQGSAGLKKILDISITAEKCKEEN